MASSWSQPTRFFKSPLRVVVVFLFRSRENKAEKCRKLTQQLNQTRKQIERQQNVIDEQRRELAELGRQVRRMEAEKYAKQQEYRLPDDPPVGAHGYGPRLISLAVNLARLIGLRATAKVLHLLFEWFGVEQKIPHWTTIRLWMQRVGIAVLQQPLEGAEDWIWMADHSNQIGVEKTLVVLAMRASEIPEPGTTINHQDVHVLTVEPGTRWKREDMKDAYERLQEAYGTPRALIVDGATELREGAETLQQEGAIVLRDFKHYAANEFKRLIGNSEPYKQFSAQVGQTRAAIQQTELSHLTPPSAKPKSRFMNLQATLNWATTMLWLLATPSAKVRRFFTTARLEEKLGWLRNFADQVAVWHSCQNVISVSITFINEQGLFRGAASQLRQELAAHLTDSTTRVLAGRLLRFLKRAEESLGAGERLLLSTEILESSFSLYKHFERQHSKGGFTSLLPAFGALLQPTTPEMIQRAFAQVSVNDVAAWVDKNLGQTLGAKRRQTNAEFSAATKGATKLTATT